MLKKTTLVILITFLAAASIFTQDSYATDIQEIKKLMASDGETDDAFGVAVSISGNHAIVGAYMKDAGVSGKDAGAAYIFYKDLGNQGNWRQVSKLTANDAEANDAFGTIVSISGDYAIVGAPSKLHRDKDYFQGAVYKYHKDYEGINNWGQLTKLNANEEEGLQSFGSVSISGDYVVVGAPREDSGGLKRGTAYMFYKNKGGIGNWGQLTKLTAKDAQDGDSFGGSVSISGDYVVVGAPRGDGGGWEFDSGTAYIFQKDQGGVGNWGQVAKLTASDAETSDNFAYSVSISGDNAIVGAHGESEGGFQAGAAYIFNKNLGGTDNWGQVTKLTSSDAEKSDNFGHSVSISGKNAIVGAYGENAAGSYAGAAYVFNKDHDGSGNWGQVTKLMSSDAEANDKFGGSVSISDDNIIVGSFHNDEGGKNAGAAYMFKLIPSGIEETPERTDIEIYPEVADDIITIEYYGIFNNLQASIYSLEGDLIKGQTLNGERNIISIANLSPGTYFVHVDTPEGPVVRKFVKR